VSEAHVLIIATSFNAKSKSHVMAQECRRRLEQRGVSAEVIWLRELELPFAGSPQAEGNPNRRILQDAIARSTHIVFAMPIYNGDVNGAARNVVNLGGEFASKTVGFLCAAGGSRSYMAVFSIGASLMFEYECWIVPRHVYAEKNDFTSGVLTNPEILNRMEKMISDLLGRSLPKVLAST
jgi:FMN reductase